MTGAVRTVPVLDSTMAYVESGSGDPIVFCFPNADAGSRALIGRARGFCADHAAARLFVNLHPRIYWGLLRHARLMIGNSSRFSSVNRRSAVPRSSVGETVKTRVVITSRALANSQIVSLYKYPRTSSVEKMPTKFPALSTTGK